MDTPVIALAGGVGGAKLAFGLASVLKADELTIVVNTGDDETFHGLHVSPDLDTMMYTLAGLANPETGWGLAGDTFNALERLKSFSVPTWFALGDSDLATHIRRTELLNQGYTLSESTRSLCTALGVEHPVVPMSDEPVRTVLLTDEGELPFQVYFVKRRCEPIVKGVRFDGLDRCKPAPRFAAAMDRAASMIFCPSNPYLSVDPILAVPDVRTRIKAFPGLRVAISPIVGGKALRGPAAKMMEELGQDVSCVAVAKHYQGLCDLIMIDKADRHHRREIEELGMSVDVTDTVMTSDEDKVRLARHICGLSVDSVNSRSGRCDRGGNTLE